MSGWICNRIVGEFELEFGEIFAGVRDFLPVILTPLVDNRMVQIRLGLELELGLKILHLCSITSMFSLGVANRLISMQVDSLPLDSNFAAGWALHILLRDKNI